MSRPHESDFAWLAPMLQTVDPLFPIGSYAHSYGLEEMAALGYVNDRRSLEGFLAAHLEPSLARLELPYLRFAYTFHANDEELAAIDAELSALKVCRELRQASLRQGQQRLRTLRKARPHPALERLHRLAQEGLLAPNHIVVYAIECRAADTPLRAALAAWAYQSLAAACAAALKIIRIGQEGAQLALTASLARIARIIDDSLAIERDLAGHFDPLLEIASARHEQAFSRLFIS